MRRNEPCLNHITTVRTEISVRRPSLRFLRLVWQAYHFRYAQRITACPTPPTFSGISLSAASLTIYLLLGSASSTPIMTDYARQKHNSPAQWIYYLSPTRLRIYFRWSNAVPTISIYFSCLGPCHLKGHFYPDKQSRFKSANWKFRYTKEVKS